MAISNLYPAEGPTLNLNFANSRILDRRITFTRTTGGTIAAETALADCQWRCVGLERSAPGSVAGCGCVVSGVMGQPRAGVPSWVFLFVATKPDLAFLHAAKAECCRDSDSNEGQFFPPRCGDLDAQRPRHAGVDG